jgi:AcrR family transcriptional regulator
VSSTDAPQTTSAPAAGDGPTRRADAQRNHEDVFAAAVHVFAERGEDATVPEIAARAGVGKATVYRNYPTKQDLVAAVARGQLDWLDQRVQAASSEKEPLAALAQLLGDISGRLAEDRLFSKILSSVGSWHGHERLVETFTGLLADGQRRGLIRADATFRDVSVLVGGFSRVLLEQDVRDPEQWRRYTMLVLDALRPLEA